MDPPILAGSTRGEFGSDGELDTQTVPSTDGESGTSAANGDALGRDVDNVEPSFEDLAPAAGAVRARFMSLDALDFEDFFRRWAMMRKTVTKFLRGPFRSVLRIAVQEELSTDVAKARKRLEVVFVSKEKLTLRFEKVTQGGGWN